MLVSRMKFTPAIWMISLTILLRVTSVSAHPTLIEKLKLPDCQTLNTLWKQRYHRELKVSWTLKDIKCTGSNDDRVLAEAAFVLENTRFNIDQVPADMALPPLNMLSFVTSKYNRMELWDEAYPAMDIESKTMYFDRNIGTKNGFHPDIFGNLVHEARHADGPDFLHIMCLGGKLKGKESCDNDLVTTFDAGGPHSISLLYFAWISYRSNWPSASKQKLKSLMTALLDTRINRPRSERELWLKRLVL